MIPLNISLSRSQMTKLIIAFIHCIFLEKIKAEKLEKVWLVSLYIEFASLGLPFHLD